jgi:uncharacterized protein DUF4440
MNASLRIPRYAQGFAAGLLLFSGGRIGAAADPPPGAENGAAASPSPSDAQSPTPKGSFLSALKQGFTEDFDQEVVRGHFDVGSPPNTQRYYCLVNTKTGKNEVNGVAGQLVLRADKMTGIKGAAVSPLSCADAEQKGILITSGYILSASVSSKITAAPPVQKPSGSAAAALPPPAIGPGAAERKPAAAAAVDKVQVSEAISSMFAAATADDLAKFHSIAAPDFYAFDGGKRFTGDALMELIKTLHASGKVYVWNVTEPEVHIYRDIAWISYVNQGSIQDASGITSMTWLESAVLRKENGLWHVLFLHSTRAP